MDRREAIKRTALLTGMALSASTLAGVLQGCQPESRPVGEPWAPKFFSAEQGAALAEIGETILPATDTPGAKDVKVHEFIDQLAKECMLPEEQELLRRGVEGLLANFKAKNGKAFTEATPEERLAYLNQMDAEAKTLVEENPLLPPEEYPAFLTVKQLVLLGYFTSEQVGTEVTAFLPIPGGYKPCMPYEQGQPAWTY